MGKIRKRNIKGNRKPLVSVVITTKNEEEVLERLILSVKSQTYTNIEIIVVDNFSTDRTLNIAREYTTKFFKKGPERSAQRNLGVKKAKGKYVLILDSDMQLTQGVIKECVTTLEKNEIIAGLNIPEESVASNFWEQVKAFERSFYNAEGDENTDAARFFRKKVFDKLGGYDEDITGPEDWDLPERMKKSGFEISRIKSKIYHFERIKSPISVAKKKYYYALRANVYLKKHDISVFGPKTIYFLRPVFYKNYKKLLKHPIHTIGLTIMLTTELIFGAVGFFLGKILFGKK